MRITLSRIAFSVVAFALAACSSAPPDSPLQGQVNPSASTKKKTSKTTSSNDDSEGQNPDSGTTPSADPTDPASPATPATPAPTTGQCSAETSFDTCMQCCDQAFPGGFEVDAQAFGQCACESPGVCAAACAGSFCAGAQATAACEQCLAAATQCETVAETACNANASCSGVFTCMDTSGCEAKP